MLTDRQTPDDIPLVSVIVPSYNSARTIRACLEAVLGQETGRSYEVIVVDSSTDGTADIVGREYPGVRLIRRRERTFAGAARNAGVRASRGRYVVMIDSDCVASRDVLERMVRRHEGGGYAAVGGSVGNGTPGSLSGTVGFLIEFKELMPSTPERFERSVPTGNAAYRREVFERFGYFDEDMWLTEDLLFNWRLYEAGEKLLFDPEIRAVHLNRTGWRTVLLYQVALGRTSAEARRRGAVIGSKRGDLLFRFPFLIALLPFVRTAHAAAWFAKYDRKTLLLFLLIWPLYFVAAAFWSYGLLQGVLKDK